MPLRPLLVFGTRPEAIKMAPVVKACQLHPDIEPIVCVTGQHRELLSSVNEYFGIIPDIDLDLMQENQTLAKLTSRCLERLDEVFTNEQPDCTIAQGDTTSVMVTALTAYYHRVPFVHIEAGLRTGNVYAPWPEEVNRRIASLVTALHCTPTQDAADNLLQAGALPHTVHVTGNTVIDSLRWTLQRERLNSAVWEQKHAYMAGKRSILMTAHRRESFGKSFENICKAIKILSKTFPTVHFIYPVHLNPNVQRPVYNILSRLPNVHLIKPAPYPEFVWLMDRSTLILTDSGSIQEEAPTLQKPVLVMRDTTERPEVLDAGATELVGSDVSKIVRRVTDLLSDPADYARHLIDKNPYGDGQAADRIISLICQQGWGTT